MSNISSSNYTTKKMRRMQLEVVWDVDREKQFEEEKLLVPYGPSLNIRPLPPPLRWRRTLKFS